MLHRRSLLRGLTLPLAAPLLSAFDAPAKLKIGAVELLKLEGHRQAVTGVNQQPQVKPNDVYDELRPKPYRDGTPAERSAPTSALYVRIRTDQGLDGIYGPIEREAGL